MQLVTSHRRRLQLLQGDCLSTLARLPSACVDSFVTDPPYGIDLKLRSNRARPLSIAGDRPDEARQLWRDFLPEAHRVAKPNSAHLFFATWKSIWIRDVLAEHFTIKGCIVWYKNTWGFGWYLRPRWELMWLCHKGEPPLPDKAPPDVWEHARDHRLQHPCQKPVELLRRAVAYVCPEGGLVCDPFAGIFSTAVAAAVESRRFIGCEISPRYVRRGRQRLLRLQNPSRARARRALPRHRLEGPSNPRHTARCASPAQRAHAQNSPRLRGRIGPSRKTATSRHPSRNPRK